MKIPAHAKYQIIYDTMQKNDNLLNVAAMCEIAGVSRCLLYTSDLEAISMKK